MQSSIVNFMSDPVLFKSLEVKIVADKNKHVLKITGSLYLTELLSNIRLVRSIPQGINPKELLLEFTCDSRCPVTKHVFNPFTYSTDVESKNAYNSIKLIYEGWISESFVVE
jgi:hypothetical protein